MKVIRTNDSSIIARLNEPVQELHFKMYPDKFKEYDFESVNDYFKDIIDGDKQYFFIAEEDGEALGYIWFQEIVKEATAFSYERSMIYINQISVNPNNKGKGIGKDLVAQAINHAKENKITKIGLDYYIKNELSKKIYEKMGFEVVSEVAFIDLD